MANINGIVYMHRTMDLPITRDQLDQIHYEIGTKLKVRMKIDKSRKTYLGEVVDDYSNFFNIRIDAPLGSYLISINKVDMLLSINPVICEEVA